MTIEELFQYCKVPASCSTEVACEGEAVIVKGYIDWDNIFDKKNYPNLPYEKFKIVDKNGNSLEVWAVSDENRSIFDAIYAHRTDTQCKILIKGVAVGVDLPVMGSCRRMIRIELKKSRDVAFE